MARRLLQKRALHHKIRAATVRDGRILHAVSANDLERALAGAAVLLRPAPRQEALLADRSISMADPSPGAHRLAWLSWSGAVRSPATPVIRIDFEGGAAPGFG
ncbi:MAG: hypothetical protein MZV70_36415 [Desulfobacterales bacterium]|nr:hypothetical protein [Desulfobacterales bacterium]